MPPRVTRSGRRETSRTSTSVTQQPHQASPLESSQPPASSQPPPLRSSPPNIRKARRNASRSVASTSAPYILSSQTPNSEQQGPQKRNLRTAPVTDPQAKGARKKNTGQKEKDTIGQERKEGKELHQEVEEKNPQSEPKTICISTFVRDQDIAAMPSLEVPIAKKRRTNLNLSPQTRPRAGSSQYPSNANHRLSNGTSTTSSKPAHSNTDSNHAAKPRSLRKKEDELNSLERNIDKIIFGDMTFKAWYPSWYPKEIIGEKALDGKGMGITVQELYVCKRCFGYSKVLTDWIRHCRSCEKGVPGQKIYDHGDDGVWSIWEVDGGVETLFCQNLSLFAKLFLDNKSVFFDVSGFNYFLLVHTSPPSSPSAGEQQIIGFFSKEKMSWDNNNLACILIFPPWQRKGLGALLMGVSYEIARREGIMGGPEKPISELGRKGYKRYWGAEIARWFLEVKETDRKKGKGLVDVETVSKETWIAPEDCLAIMREMGIVEKAGRGKGTVERVRIDKERVREWVKKERLALDRVVDDGGFVEGYGYKEVPEEEEEV